MNGTTMNNSIMTYRYIITNSCAIFLVRTMNTGAVLYIHFVAHFNKIYISSDHRIEPDTAIVTHDHITDNSSIGSNKTIVSKLGVFVFYRKY